MNLLSSLIAPVLAQDVGSDKVIFGNIAGISDLRGLFTFITNVTIIIGVSLVVVFLILAGIQYITARGDVKQADAARQALTNAIIGFIVVIAAITIRTVVLKLVGLDAGVIDDIAPTP